jgi:hypothetical protein
LITGAEGKNGKNWCPDCEQTKSEIKYVLDNSTADIILVGVVAKFTQWVGK